MHIKAKVELQDSRDQLNMDSIGGCRDKMVSRVYKGIPDSMRGAAWKLLLDIDRKKEEQRGRYRVRTPPNILLSSNNKSNSIWKY